MSKEAAGSTHMHERPQAVASTHGVRESHAPRLLRRIRRNHQVAESYIPTPDVTPVQVVTPLQSEIITSAEDTKAQTRKKNGTIGALVRNGKLRAEHVGENGEINMEAVLKDKYFREDHPEYNELLANHTLSKKGKLRKAAENLPKSAEVDSSSEIGRRRVKRGLAVLSAETGAVLFAGVVTSTAVAADENTREARAEARADALVQASAATGKDLNNYKVVEPTPAVASAAPAVADVPKVAVAPVPARLREPVADSTPAARQVVVAPETEVPAVTPTAKAAPVQAVEPAPQPAALAPEASFPTPAPTVQAPEAATPPTDTEILARVNDQGKAIYDARVAAGDSPEELAVLRGILFGTYDQVEANLGADGSISGRDGKGSEGPKTNPGHGEEGHDHTNCEVVDTTVPPVITIPKTTTSSTTSSTVYTPTSSTSIPKTTSTSSTVPVTVDTTTTTTTLLPTTTSTMPTTTTTTNAPTTSTSSTLAPTTTTTMEIIVTPATFPKPKARVTTTTTPLVPEASGETTASTTIPTRGPLVRTGENSGDLIAGAVLTLGLGAAAVAKTFRSKDEFNEDTIKRKAKKLAKTTNKMNKKAAKENGKKAKAEAKDLKKAQEWYRKDREDFLKAQAVAEKAKQAKLASEKKWYDDQVIEYNKAQAVSRKLVSSSK